MVEAGGSGIKGHPQIQNPVEALSQKHPHLLKKKRISIWSPSCHWCQSSDHNMCSLLKVEHCGHDHKSQNRRSLWACRAPPLNCAGFACVHLKLRAMAGGVLFPYANSRKQKGVLARHKLPSLGPLLLYALAAADGFLPSLNLSGEWLRHRVSQLECKPPPLRSAWVSFLFTTSECESHGF